MTWGRYFWPWFLGVAFAIGMTAEIFALVVNWRNTLSDWVWTELNVQRNVSPWDWSATHALIFGVWLVTFVWLTFHFFFHRWT